MPRWFVRCVVERLHSPSFQPHPKMSTPTHAASDVVTAAAVKSADVAMLQNAINGVTKGAMTQEEWCAFLIRKLKDMHGCVLSGLRLHDAGREEVQNIVNICNNDPFLSETSSQAELAKLAKKWKEVSSYLRSRSLRCT